MERNGLRKGMRTYPAPLKGRVHRLMKTGIFDHELDGLDERGWNTDDSDDSDEC